tara:strand:+ start:921 stop:1604 length:684 start_codon:yes stop_codon:yes gene_type:complete
MPIRKVKGGYKWGKRGKVYRSRKDAERQAAAAYASGYKKSMDWFDDIVNKKKEPFTEVSPSPFGFAGPTDRTFTNKEFNDFLIDVEVRVDKIGRKNMDPRDRVVIGNLLMELGDLAEARKNNKDNKVSLEFKEKLFKLETILDRYGGSMRYRHEDILQSDWFSTIKAKKKRKSTVNQAGNYTKPKMRKRQFQRIKAGSKGGPAGKWSARKAQMLAQAYKRAGGGYRD